MIVFKYGGNAISESVANAPVLELLANMIQSGSQMVVVHGGGPQIDRELGVHGISSQSVKGLRVTTPEIFEVVQRTLSGEVLRNLVASFIRLGINVVGLSAADGGLIRAKVLDPDLGLVGEIESIETTLLDLLLSNGFTPVVSPVGVSRSGVGLNLNADLVAGAIGGSCSAESVLFSTNVSGIYRDWPDESTLIDEISVGELAEIAGGFDSGMAPKVNAAIYAINMGAKSARIFDGRSAAVVAKALAGNAGTLVVA